MGNTHTNLMVRHIIEMYVGSEIPNLNLSSNGDIPETKKPTVILKVTDDEKFELFSKLSQFTRLYHVTEYYFGFKLKHLLYERKLLYRFIDTR